MYLGKPQQLFTQSPSSKFRLGPSILVRNFSPLNSPPKLSKAIPRILASPNRLSTLSKPSFSNFPPIRKTVSPLPMPLMARKSVKSVRKVERLEASPRKLQKIAQIANNVNEFVRLLERDKKRKNAIINKLTRKIENIRTDFYRNMEEDRHNQSEQSISALRSCKDFELDITTTSELLKDHNFYFRGSQVKKEKEADDANTEQKASDSKHQSNPKAALTNDMLIYYMLFNLVDDKPKKDKLPETTINRLNDIETKLEYQNQAMRIIPRTNPNPEPNYSPRPHEQSPRFAKPPPETNTFNQKVLSKLSAIETKVMQVNFQPSKNPLMRKLSHNSAPKKKEGEFHWRNECRNIQTRLNEQLASNLENLDKNLHPRSQAANKRPVYLPTPFI
jgi:hypothetical protein